MKVTSKKIVGKMLVRDSAMWLLCVCVCVFVHSVMSDSLQPHGLEPTRLVSMEFPRQKYWSWLPFPSPGDLPDPGIESASLVSHALAGEFFTAELPGKPFVYQTSI